MFESFNRIGNKRDRSKETTGEGGDSHVSCVYESHGHQRHSTCKQLLGIDVD